MSKGMQPETVEHIEKTLVKQRDAARSRLEDLIRMHSDPARHPVVLEAINELKATETRVDDFREWREEAEDE